MNHDQKEQDQPGEFQLDVVNDEGRVLVELRSVQDSWTDTDPAHQLDAKNISQFNHWLASTPVAATTVAGNSKQLLTCSFDYGRLVQANDGSGALGWVRKEGSNQIAAQARLHEADQLKAMVNTSMVFNIASQLVAQKHLADINERLQSIDKNVQEIKDHLEHARVAKIETFQEHLRRVGRLMAEGEELTTDTLQILAENAQTVRAEVKHIQRDLREAHKAIADFDASSWFGSNDLRDDLRKKIDRVGHLQREYLLGMQCLLLANLILFTKHNGNKEFVLAAQDYVQELQAEQGLLGQWEQLQRKVAFHLSKMKPLFERSSSTQANAVLVEKSVSRAQLALSQDIGQVQHLGARLLQAQKPRVLLEMEGGQVVRGRYLPAE